MDKKSWIFVIVFALIVIAGILLWLRLGAGGGVIAVITVDGAEYDRVDLSRVKEPYDIEISTQYGHNTVHVEPGAISVTEADCPDLICVYMGKLTGDGIPIICMPHRLMIYIEDSGIDG